MRRAGSTPAGTPTASTSARAPRTWLGASLCRRAIVASASAAYVALPVPWLSRQNSSWCVPNSASVEALPGRGRMGGGGQRGGCRERPCNAPRAARPGAPAGTPAHRPTGPLPTAASSWRLRPLGVRPAACPPTQQRPLPTRPPLVPGGARGLLGSQAAPIRHLPSPPQHPWQPSTAPTQRTAGSRWGSWPPASPRPHPPTPSFGHHPSRQPAPQGAHRWFQVGFLASCVRRLMMFSGMPVGVA